MGFVVHLFLHEDPLAVVTIDVAEAVYALFDLADFIKPCVGDGLSCLGEVFSYGCRGVHGVRFGRGAELRIIENELSVGGLGGHAAIAVIDRRSRQRRA